MGDGGRSEAGEYTSNTVSGHAAKHRLEAAPCHFLKAFTEDLHTENKDAQGTNELEEVEKSVVHTLPESGRDNGTGSVGDFRVLMKSAII